MTTFSQMIDKLVAETKRPDLRTEIVTYLNQTIRETHMNPENGKVVMFDANYQEAVVTATQETGQTWSLPRPQVFQCELCVKFLDQFWNGKNPYAERVRPGVVMDDKDFFYYRGGSQFVFGGTRGYGGVGARIAIAWYEYPRDLVYYAADSRPCSWDDATQEYTYLSAVTEDQKEAARIQCTNWILERWASLLEEGLRAKVYKRLSDDGRQRTSYSMWMQLRAGIISSEQSDLGVYLSR